MAKYIIGTRGSLLALTQCGQIKDELERITGDEFSLKVIKTQGDQIVDKPLWQLEGKDFFTKELDAALLTGDVDMVVHSYKDLGSERPEGIHLAAITKRSFASDILLIKDETISKIKEKKTFIVGTSSPRRIVNIEKNLGEYLPTDQPIEVKTKILRGNVNTRIERLLSDEYDAIILAHAGVERLARTASSMETLKSLLKDLNFMVLPQSVFPSAASQGALAIECLENRSDNGELLEKLKKVEDKITISEVSRERQAFRSYGGGCHLAVGINVKKFGDYYLHIHAGKTDEKEVNDIQIEGSFQSASKKAPVFVGLPNDRLSKYIESNPGLSISGCELIKKTPLKAQDISGERFIATNFGLEEIKDNGSCLYTAGVKTWKSLAKKGLWVNASSDSRGEEEIESIRSSLALKVMRENKSSDSKTINLFSHKDSPTNFNLVESYKREVLELNADQEERFLSNQFFFWSSFSSYQDYVAKYPQIKERFHMCGIGKTLDLFKEEGISVRPFLDIDSALVWVSTLS